MARAQFKISLLVLATSALLSAPLMTRPGFDTIELGAPIDRIIREFGEPYSIKPNTSGSKDYLYIERLRVSEDIVQENRYILVIKNGQVASKRLNQEHPPAYDEIYDDDPNDIPE